MPEQFKKKNYATTAGTEWPDIGTIPAGETVAGAVLTVAGGSTDVFIRDSASPGVAPLVLPQRPIIKKDVWIYANAELRRIKARSIQITAEEIRLILDRPFSAPLTNVAFEIVKKEYRNVSVSNIGAAPGTINSENFPVGQTISFIDETSGGVQKRSDPIWYDADGTEFAIQVE